MITWTAAKQSAVSALLAILGAMAAPAANAPLDSAPPIIQGLEVDNRPFSWVPGKELSLGTFPRNIVFQVGPATTNNQKLMRLRTKLEGVDQKWLDGGGSMFVTVRFYNSSGDLIADKLFEARGENAGWTGTLEGSAFTHRREAFTAPLDAARLSVVISSAGGPSTVGIYVVDNLIISRVPGNNGSPEVLFRSPVLQDSPNGSALNQAPQGWERNGIRPSMAKIVEVGQNPGTRAFAIVDDDPLSHAEWQSTKESAAHVSPSFDNLVMEWNENASASA